MELLIYQNLYLEVQVVKAVQMKMVIFQEKVEMEVELFLFLLDPLLTMEQYRQMEKMPVMVQMQTQMDLTVRAVVWAVEAEALVDLFLFHR